MFTTVEFEQLLKETRNAKMKNTLNYVSADRKLAKQRQKM